MKAEGERGSRGDRRKGGEGEFQVGRVSWPTSTTICSFSEFSLR